MSPSLLGLLLAVVPETARVLVVPVSAGGSSADAPRVQAEVQAELRWRPGLSLVSREELLASDTDPTPDPECVAEPGCLSRRLASVSARYALVVVLNQKIQPPFLALRLFDARLGRAEHSTSGSLEAAGGHWARPLRARVRELLDRAGHPPRSRLRLRLRPEESTVELRPPSFLVAEGQPLPGGALSCPQGQCVLWVEPGTFHLRARAPEHQEASAEALVGPEAESVVELFLTAREEALWSSPWFWVGVGAAAVGAGAAVYLLSAGPRCACVGPAECPPCD